LDTDSNIVPDNPAEILDEKSDLYALHRLFDASQSSRRLFSEIHYFARRDPNLTIGMGHWTEGNIAELFHRLKSDDQLWQDVTDIWGSLLSEAQWSQLNRETHVSERGGAGIIAALDQVLCASDPSGRCVANNLVPWASKVGEKFNESDHWFNAGWKRISRLRPIATAQLLFWIDSVLERGVRDAQERGIWTRGGVASVISARSSAIGTTMFEAGIEEVQAKHGSVSRQWSLVNVPSSAKPLNRSQITHDQLLQDWRAVVAWQYYTIKKERIRSRMSAIWKTFYEESWGPLRSDSSLEEATSIPRHLGEPMNDQRFDFTVKLKSRS
jgi:hypothetical protein